MKDFPPWYLRHQRSAPADRVPRVRGDGSTLNCAFYAWVVISLKFVYRERYGVDYQKYIYWQDGDMWLGYLDRYPDYWTQGETQEELRENLRDIYGELTGGHIL